MSMNKKEMIIYTDGACSGNPGSGGWAAVLIYSGDISSKKSISGGQQYTTNNKMELKAAINGLKELRTPCKVTLHTDSLYIKHGITIWINKWKINGWKTADKKPVKNMELWKELDTATLQHDIDWRWVKAHKV